MPTTNFNLQVPLINGVIWSFAHLTMVINTVEYSGGFKSITYPRKRDREMVYSNSVDPVGKTLGQNSYTCSAELYLEWFRLLINSLAQDGVGYGNVSFPIIVKYNNNGFAPFVDTIVNCTIDTTDFDNQVGTGALTRKVDFNPTKIYYDGLDDAGNPLAA